MTDVIAFDRDAVETAVDIAVRAPSIHNTQPWLWRLHDGVLDLRADRDRQLGVADPDGHSLLVSCGAALHLTVLALAAEGWQVDTAVLPDAADPDLLARMVPTGRGEPDAAIGVLLDAALRRRSDRRPFARTEIDDDGLERLRSASSDDVAWVDFPHGEDQRVDLAVAVSWADRVERDDDAYLAEMRRWLNDPDVHDPAEDGIPLGAIPHVPADQPRRIDVPLRDFERGVTGQQLIERDVDEKPIVAVVLTPGDSAADHLHAGVSMMKLMLAAEVDGISTCVLSQAVDFAAFRTRVQRVMGWVGHPQIMLRVGFPPTSGEAPAPTPRRGAAAVLDVVE